MAITECFVLLVVTTTFASASLEADYTNSAYLDEDEHFRLHWKINNDEKEISFAVQVKTLGWIGLGISPTGNMVGSDVVIGWIKDGTAYLKDRFADEKAFPPIDDEQNYKLESGYENNGETVLKFSRKYDTCDDRDNKIEEGTVRLVYAYHTDDPTSHTNIPMHKKRGSRSLVLRNILTKKPSLPKDLQHFDLRVNASISNRDTTYYCKPFRIPDVGSRKHIVKISPVITPGNKGLVHHILVYGCRDDFPVSNLSTEGACHSPNMPGSFRACLGQSVVAAWAIGGSSFYFPAHVGYPLGGADGQKFVLMEVHYDNPDKKSGLKDLSGLRFYYTSSLRKYDAGVLWVGWAVIQSMMVPPMQKKWNSIGYCSGNCTRIGFENSTLPEKGIKVFATLLHAHLLGSALWTKHVRNGQELPEIARDDHYDFNYQEYHINAEETHILPGDDIIQTCQYNSLKRKTVTYGGLESKQEMCMNFMYYYPKIALSKCLSINYGVHYFFERNFRKNGSIVGYPPKQWTNELSADLNKSYVDMKYINAICVKHKMERLEPVDGEYVEKAVIIKPFKKVKASCPKDPSSIGNHVIAYHALIVIAVLQACMVLY